MRGSHRPIEKALRRMHMPIGLAKAIKAGTLVRDVEAAFAQIDALNALLDDWEVRNPDAARLAPWHAGREAWKAAGRPRPHWVEALLWSETHGGDHASPPIKVGEIEKDLLCLHQRGEHIKRQ